MKRIVLLGLCLIFLVPSAYGQGATNVPAAGGISTTASDIESAITAEKERMEEEIRKLDDKLLDKEIELEELERRIDVTKNRIPALERQEVLAKEKLEKARSYYESVSDNYASLERSAREDLARRLVVSLNDRFSTEYREKMAAYQRDRKIIEENIWLDSDFDNLEIETVDSMGKVYKLVFKNRTSVSGYFPTADSDSGERTWHKVPPRATFKYSIMDANPFVCKVTVNSGFSKEDLVSTNSVSRNVDLFLAKHFARHRVNAGIRFELLAVAWHVDLDRVTCFQFCDPPVFRPTPEPALEVADSETEDIKKGLESWSWTDPGWEQRKIDANRAFKEAQQLVRIIGEKIPEEKGKIEKRQAELEKDLRTISEEIEKLKMTLDEYRRALKATAPSGEGGGTEAPLEFEVAPEAAPPAPAAAPATP